MLEIALLSVSALLVLLLALLAVPVTVRFRIDRSEEVDGQVGVRWFFGLVHFQTAIPPAKGPKRGRKEKAAAGRKKKRRFSGARGVYSLLKEQDFRLRALRFVKDLLTAVRRRDLYLRLRVGLGDPADTGRLWALLGPLAGIAASLNAAEVRMEPEFLDSVLEVESRGEVRVVPLRILTLAGAFVLSPPTLRALYLLHRESV